MKRSRLWSLLLCLLAGCSTHPLVDIWDYFKPGKLGPNKVAPYGGVAIPQGPIVPVAPAFPGAAGGSVIPPPAALPGNQGPGGLQLQPPTPGDIPIPPPPPPPKS